MARKAPRVPEIWKSQFRPQLEAELRQQGIQKMPSADAKLQCPNCGNRNFRVWFDRGQCGACMLYVKLETLKKGELKLAAKGPDGEAFCQRCHSNEHYVYEDRLICVRCRMVQPQNPRILAYWPMEELTGGRAVQKSIQTGMSRSTIYRHIKKLEKGNHDS